MDLIVLSDDSLQLLTLLANDPEHAHGSDEAINQLSSYGLIDVHIFDVGYSGDTPYTKYSDPKITEFGKGYLSAWLRDKQFREDIRRQADAAEKQAAIAMKQSDEAQKASKIATTESVIALVVSVLALILSFLQTFHLT